MNTRPVPAVPSDGTQSERELELAAEIVRIRKSYQPIFGQTPWADSIARVCDIADELLAALIARDTCRGSVASFIALIKQVAHIEKMIAEGLAPEMPCKKKHIYREQAFLQVVSLSKTHFAAAINRQNINTPNAKRKNRSA